MKKPILFICLLLSFVFAFSACGTNEQQKEEKTEELLTYDRYSEETYLSPFWSGKVVYNETLLFVGEDDAAPLMYQAEEIISVRSYDLKTEFKEGVDYIFDKANNLLSLTASTSMPYLTVDEYYPTTYVAPTDKGTLGCTLPNHDYIWFQEYEYFCSKQVAVTYRHGGTDYLSKPDSDSDEFNKQMSALVNKEKVKIQFYGDSITVGANASSYVTYGPYAPTWSRMVYNKLVKDYSLSGEYRNSAVGGWTSQDAIDNLDRITEYVPDILFIAFGMNDVQMPLQDHKDHLFMVIRDAALKVNPDCVICVVSTMLPNSEVQGFYGNQKDFNTKYPELVRDVQNAYNHHVFFADVTSVHKEILTRKRYRDGTGNNVNHPNDFISRVYAQTVLQTLCGD